SALRAALATNARQTPNVSARRTGRRETLRRVPRNMLPPADPGTQRGRHTSAVLVTSRFQKRAGVQPTPRVIESIGVGDETAAGLSAMAGPCSLTNAIGEIPESFSARADRAADSPWESRQRIGAPISNL